MKTTIFLLFVATMIFAQDWQYEKNLNLGNSDTANYTIVKGDNLWNLAMQYYGDGFEWRYIWEHNRYIKDPHWIFPGNKLLIPAIRGLSVPDATAVQLYDTAKPLNQLVEQTRKMPSKHQLSLAEKFKYYFSHETLRQAPFIYEYNAKHQVDVFAYGEVVDNGRPILVQHRDALVKMNKSVQAEKDSRMDFYAIHNNLPLRGVKGVIVEPAATGLVKFTKGEIATVFIDRLWGVLNVGSKVAPPRTHNSLGNHLTYRVLNDSLNAGVIARMSPDISLKPGGIIFIDKGTNESVSIGDHFVFFERDRSRRSKQKHVGESVAEGLIIATENKTATIKITSVREFSSANTFTGVRQGRIVAR